MGNVLIKAETMTQIADAIREKTGGTDKILPADMADEIKSIEDYKDVFTRVINKTIKELDLSGTSVTIIGATVFADCYNLESIVFPECDFGIRAQAFQKCTALTSLVFPKNLMAILEFAFSNCSNLANVTFEGVPGLIYSSAFEKSTNLTTINVPWSEGEVENAPWGATNATINYNYTGEE